MRANLDTTVTTNTTVIIEFNPIFIAGDGFGRAVFPTFAAQAANRWANDRFLDKVTAHLFLKGPGAKADRAQLGQIEIGDTELVAGALYMLVIPSKRAGGTVGE